MVRPVVVADGGAGIGGGAGHPAQGVAGVTGVDRGLEAPARPVPRFGQRLADAGGVVVGVNEEVAFAIASANS